MLSMSSDACTCPPRYFHFIVLTSNSSLEIQWHHGSILFPFHFHSNKQICGDRRLIVIIIDWMYYIRSFRCQTYSYCSVEVHGWWLLDFALIQMICCLQSIKKKTYIKNILAAARMFYLLTMQLRCIGQWLIVGWFSLRSSLFFLPFSSSSFFPLSLSPSFLPGGLLKTVAPA